MVKKGESKVVCTFLCVALMFGFVPARIVCAEQQLARVGNVPSELLEDATHGAKLALGIPDPFADGGNEYTYDDGEGMTFTYVVGAPTNGFDDEPIGEYEAPITVTQDGNAQNGTARVYFEDGNAVFDIELEGASITGTGSPYYSPPAVETQRRGTAIDSFGVTYPVQLLVEGWYSTGVENDAIALNHYVSSDGSFVSIVDGTESPSGAIAFAVVLIVVIIIGTICWFTTWCSAEQAIRRPYQEEELFA